MARDEMAARRGTRWPPWGLPRKNEKQKMRDPPTPPPHSSNERRGAVVGGSVTERRAFHCERPWDSGTHKRRQ